MTEKTRLEQRIEKFNTIDPETGELVLDKELLLKDYIKRGVEILKEIDLLKMDTKQLLEDAEDDKIDKSELKSLIKYAYKDTISAEIERLEGVQSKLNNIFLNDVC